MICSLILLFNLRLIFSYISGNSDILGGILLNQFSIIIFFQI